MFGNFNDLWVLDEQELSDRCRRLFRIEEGVIEGSIHSMGHIMYGNYGGGSQEYYLDIIYKFRDAYWKWRIPGDYKFEKWESLRQKLYGKMKKYLNKHLEKNDNFSNFNYKKVEKLISIVEEFMIEHDIPYEGWEKPDPRRLYKKRLRGWNIGDGPLLVVRGA